MEEFRQQIVDKSVMALVAKRVVTQSDFTMQEGLCKLSNSARKALITDILEKFESYVRVGEIKMRWSDLILHQARNIAKYLRGEIAKYEGFYLRW